MTFELAGWRYPRLARIGQAMARYETCRCPKCRAAVEREIHSYDRATR